MDDPSRYPIPAGRHRVEEVVRRSRFLTTAAHAAEPEDAHALVADVRAERPEATHHCWAFVAGPPGSTARVGMSDDGEPHGTAGRPMLTTLLHGGVGEIVVVCSRYFGGVKLGTGGLSRAYASGVKQVLASLPTVERVDLVLKRVTLGYPDVDGFRRMARDLGVRIEDEDFGADVRFRCAVPSGDTRRFVAAVADLTQGRGTVAEV